MACGGQPRGTPTCRPLHIFVLVAHCAKLTCRPFLLVQPIPYESGTARPSFDVTSHHFSMREIQKDGDFAKWPSTRNKSPESGAKMMTPLMRSSSSRFGFHGHFHQPAAVYTSSFTKS